MLGEVASVSGVSVSEQICHVGNLLYQPFHGDLLSLCREGSSLGVRDYHDVGRRFGSGAHQPSADAIVGNAAFSGHVYPDVPGYDGAFDR